MAKLEVKLEVEWKERPCTGDKECLACEERIFGPQYGLFFKYREKYKALRIWLCSACYSLIEEE